MKSHIERWEEVRKNPKPYPNSFEHDDEKKHLNKIRNDFSKIKDTFLMELMTESKKFSFYYTQYKYDSFLSNSHNDISWMLDLVKFLVQIKDKKFYNYIPVQDDDQDDDQDEGQDEGQSNKNREYIQLDTLSDFLASSSELNHKTDSFLEAYDRLNRRLFKRVINK